jgi:uncharacterized protein (TIGR03437 family)
MQRIMRHLLVLIVVAAGLIGMLFAAAAPTIKSVSPVSGYHGSAITITGTNFGATQGKSIVTFNGTPATSFVSWSDTVIKTGVPQGAPLGIGKVVVTVDGIASNAVQFSVKLRPK